MQSHELKDAFRHRDRPRATQVALDLYRINARMMEAALRGRSTEVTSSLSWAAVVSSKTARASDSLNTTSRAHGRVENGS